MIQSVGRPGPPEGNIESEPLALDIARHKQSSSLGATTTPDVTNRSDRSDPAEAVTSPGTIRLEMNGQGSNYLSEHADTGSTQNTQDTPHYGVMIVTGKSQTINTASITTPTDTALCPWSIQKLFTSNLALTSGRTFTLTRCFFPGVSQSAVTI